MSQRFTKEDRVRNSKEFDHIFAGKCSVADNLLVLYISANQKQQARLGMVVSKKVGNAVQRNRWKRQLRAIFRTNRDQLPEGVDLLVIPRVKDHPSHKALLKSMTSLARKANRKLQSKQGAAPQ